ncbi:hypothetical protein BOX24_06615 [Leptospirillum ferriphilum]|uniref:Uncharacterized protein n=2 Tax=Leptospirillum ferriphilum TaxID=178606 RepID=A0A1V3SV18_9BACT|nr:hypothetical protein LFML04_1635 [Leptospirillum ferriphilum ML-04]OOH72663.1 hypothetical protein BOX24_06615 [Leptospirillum ferriphilum]
MEEGGIKKGFSGLPSKQKIPYGSSSEFGKMVGYGRTCVSVPVDGFPERPFCSLNYYDRTHQKAG